MTTGTLLRRARVDDAEPLAALVASLAGHFGDEGLVEPWSGEGLSPFQQSIQPAAFRERLIDSDYRYWIAEEPSTLRLLGTIALRRSAEAHRAHLYHLFVALDTHKSGLGTRLMDHALQTLRAEDIQRLTVNSSPGAIRFYQRFGFEATADMVIQDDMAYLPMAIRLETHSPTE